MNTEILEDLGLLKSEITVFIALIELGESTSGPIIEKTSLQSSVVHRVLKSLQQKGLLTYVCVGKNKHYQAIDPKELINFVEEKKKRLQLLIPELEQKKNIVKEKNNAELFLGKKALFRMLISLIAHSKQGDNYLSFSLIEAHDDEDIIRFYKNYNLRRREKKLSVKVLVNKKVKTIYEQHYTKELLRKANVKYTTFTFPQGIIIHNNQLIFINWSETPAAVKITNKQMYQQFKTFFLEFYNREQFAYR